MVTSTGWFYWALLSAVFAALTAIFAKVGIQGVDSDLATLIRTAIIIVVLSAFVAYTGKWANRWSCHPRHGFSSGFRAWQQGHRGSAISARLRSAMHLRLHQWINSVLSWWRCLLSHFWVNARRSASGPVSRWLLAEFYCWLLSDSLPDINGTTAPQIQIVRLSHFWFRT